MSDRFTAKVAEFLIIRNGKGEVLLQQRAGTGYLNGYWDFPSGHAEYGESIRDAATRELMEETSLQAEGEDLRLVHLDQCFDPNPQHCYINFIVAVDAWKGESRVAEIEKCSGMEWFATDALPEKCVNTVRNVQQAGFSDQLTYSVTDAQAFERLVGMSLQESNN